MSRVSLRFATDRVSLSLSHVLPILKQFNQAQFILNYSALLGMGGEIGSVLLSGID